MTLYNETKENITRFFALLIYIITFLYFMKVIEIELFLNIMLVFLSSLEIFLLNYILK